MARAIIWNKPKPGCDRGTDERHQVQHVVRTLPVRQRNDDEFLHQLRRELAQLPDAFVVGAIAAANGDGTFINPNHVSAFQLSFTRDRAENWNAQSRQKCADGRWLAAAQGFAHVAENRALLRDQHRIVDVDGIQSRLIALGQIGDFRNVLLQQADKLRVLSQRFLKIRRAEIIERLPLALNISRTNKGFAGRLEQEALIFPTSDWQPNGIFMCNFLFKNKNRTCKQIRLLLLFTMRWHEFV
jgi:hypothetical protein